MSNGQNWWQRQGNFVAYPELQQGSLPHCVYASIAGAVNHLVGHEVWTAADLWAECQSRGRCEANFGVADTALTRVADKIEKHHHNKDSASEPLSVSLIRRWIDAGSVVIVSMEVQKHSVAEPSRWHMFSLVARDGDLFQIWDTNGFRGLLTGAEISSGFPYPNGMFFIPHDKEDTLVLKCKTGARRGARR